MLALSRMMESRGTRGAVWLAVSTLAVACNGWFHTRARGLQMRGAHLEHMQAPGARIPQVDFGGAALRWANLPDACLDGCNLKGADLTSANLGSASLQNASLVGANLCLANLACASLRKADLTNAHLEKANFQFADLQDAHLEGATYDQYTTLPDGYDPVALGMQFVDVK